MFLEIIACVAVFALIYFLISLLVSPSVFNLKNKHVVITGGSSGIGKALAKEAVRRGAVVSIIARTESKLISAKNEIEKIAGNSFKEVCFVPVDVTGNYEDIKAAIQKTEDKHGPVDVLINCAGAGLAKRFEDISMEEFKRNMDLNFFGSVQATKAVIERMKKQGGGRIVFLSSQAGQLGLYGYTAYSASKFALRGLAESLQMEVRPYNIYVTIAHPPDTDTPGFEHENKTKPEETKLISDTSGCFKPESVASQIIQDLMVGRFCSYIGLDGWMLANITCGMSPVHSVFDAATQVLSVSLFRLVSFFYLIHFSRIVNSCKVKREKIERDRGN